MICRQASGACGCRSGRATAPDHRCSRPSTAPVRRADGRRVDRMRRAIFFPTQRAAEEPLIEGGRGRGAHTPAPANRCCAAISAKAEVRVRRGRAASRPAPRALCAKGVEPGGRLPCRVGARSHPVSGDRPKPMSAVHGSQVDDGRSLHVERLLVDPAHGSVAKNSDRSGRVGAYGAGHLNSFKWNSGNLT